MSNILPPFALRDDALNLIEATIRARRAILDHIAPHFAGATAATGLGRPAFDGAIMTKASHGGFAFS